MVSALILTGDLLYEILLCANPKRAPLPFLKFGTVSKSWYNATLNICKRLCIESPIQFWLNFIPSKHSWTVKYYCIYHLPLDFKEDKTESLFVRRSNHELGKCFSDWVQRSTEFVPKLHVGSMFTVKSFDPWRKIAIYIGGVYYFEVHIVSQSRSQGYHCLGIGFVAPDFPESTYIGFSPEHDCVEIDGDVGLVRTRIPSSSSRQTACVKFDKSVKGALFGEGDTVGAGIDLNQDRAFFTMNGELLEDSRVSFPCRGKASWHPCISWHETFAVVNPNLGERPFMFDLQNYVYTASESYS
eukprot:TRINITY_DN1385_c0_g1_i5.p1 TRINITY_DN1385_c0_g1~~TRINITY_DN1385_c0_g1_i5.p1  ORF type:complete len:299 (-),score=-0.93 TRINITY_DN1385_c0_g1_i5:1296-2192(-)